MEIWLGVLFSFIISVILSTGLYEWARTHIIWTQTKEIKMVTVEINTIRNYIKEHESKWPDTLQWSPGGSLVCIGNHCSDTMGYHFLLTSVAFLGGVKSIITKLPNTEICQGVIHQLAQQNLERSNKQKLLDQGSGHGIVVRSVRELEYIQSTTEPNDDQECLVLLSGVPEENKWLIITIN